MIPDERAYFLYSQLRHCYDRRSDAIREQAALLKRQRKLLEDRLAQSSRRTRPSAKNVDGAALSQVRSAVAEWLQVAVVATRESATIRGVLPLHLPEFFISQHAWA